MNSDEESIRGSLPESTDVVIIGGGIMGASTAYFLSENSELDVLLVEKNSFASGSTGDSSAILRHHYGPQEEYTRMAAWGHEFYRNFESETGEVIAYEPNPFIRYAERGTATAEYVLQGYDVLESFDLPVTRYEGNLQERFPMFDFGEYDLAVSDDGAAYSDGTDAASGFIRTATRNGVSVATQTTVESVTTSGDEVVGVETDRGSVASNIVVCAAGPWTPSIARTVDVDVPIKITREQILILDPPPAYDEYYELTPTISLPGGGYYMRPDFGGGILVATHHTEEEVDPDWYDAKPDESVIFELTSKLESVVPPLADSGLRGRYCGIYSTTPDHDFIIDQAGPEGFYLLAGFSGHGFKHGPTVGRITSDLVVSGDSGLVDTEFFSLSRFEERPEGHGKPDDLA